MSVRPWVCRLYPERGSSLYVRVMVWPTKRAMLEYLNAHHITVHGNRFGNRTEGTCSGHERYTVWPADSGKARRKSPCVAEVNLWRGRLGIGVITHEFFHATMRWGYRVGFDFSALDSLDCSMTEERITYVHGNLCREFMEKGMRPGGIYTDKDIARSA